MSISPSPQASAPPESAPDGAVAILTAAGSGSHLGAEVPKTLAPVDDISLLWRAAAEFVVSGAVSHVVVTAPAKKINRLRAELADLPDGSVRTSVGRRPGIEVVAGSPRSRQAPVALGFTVSLAAAPRADIATVHDTVRALTPPEVTQRVIAAVQAGHETVVPALSVTDTVKEVKARPTGEPGLVVGTPRRGRSWTVQTSQGFSAPAPVTAYRAGAERAGNGVLAASGDAGPVEACGGSVVAVAGDERAMKMVTPIDLALAKLFLERRSA